MKTKEEMTQDMETIIYSYDCYPRANAIADEIYDYLLQIGLI